MRNINTNAHHTANTFSGDDIRSNPKSIEKETTLLNRGNEKLKIDNKKKNEKNYPMNNSS